MILEIVFSTEYEVIIFCLNFICLLYTNSINYTPCSLVCIFYMKVQYLYESHLDSLRIKWINFAEAEESYRQYSKNQLDLLENYVFFHRVCCRIYTINNKILYKSWKNTMGNVPFFSNSLGLFYKVTAQQHIKIILLQWLHFGPVAIWLHFVINIHFFITLSLFNFSDTYHIFNHGLLSILRRLHRFGDQSSSIWLNDHIIKEIEDSLVING